MAFASAQVATPAADQQAGDAVTDRAAIEAVVWTYLDGLHEGDTDKLATAFHPVSHLYSEADGAVSDLPCDRWFELVRNRPSPHSQGHARHDRIVSLDQAGHNAFVKCECAVLPRYFVDYLTLVKTREGWKIVAKAFKAETR